MTDHLDELDQVLQGGSSDEPSATTSLLRRAATLPAATPAPELLAAMAHEAGSAVDPTPHPSRRRSMLATKVATAAAAIALTATGAAAAGALPDAAQDGMAEAGTHVGLNLPDSADDEARDATTSQTEASAETEAETDAETETQEVEGDAVEGQGHTERGNQTNPTDADAHGEAVSSVATDDSLTGAEKGAAVSATARGDVEGGPDAAGTSDDEDDEDDEDANASDNAPVETPNDGNASADARAEAGAED